MLWRMRRNSRECGAWLNTALSSNISRSEWKRCEVYSKIVKSGLRKYERELALLKNSSLDSIRSYTDGHLNFLGFPFGRATPRRVARVGSLLPTLSESRWIRWSRK